ncbi:cytochrome c [Campylobacter sp. 19-13652]|uniref:c-type cytochrome n=1 Tax=Campylobacter sp. 19-13652 TaxID=2840180 RepID=UPI001C7890C2|nr:cytochrome c [Campylobacter sp. 19-13652]BCX79865.1 hypothetical protein LBC_13270 [Campylobacter sp. 19-13652]
MNIFKFLFLACAFLNVSFAASEVYYIKASGDFGKELADMAKAYAKDKNKNIEIFVDEDPRKYKETRLLSVGVNHRGNYSISLGKELYEKTCASCHGADATKRPGGATPLSKMSAKDIEDSIIAYRNDPDFGGSMRSVMAMQANQVSNADLGAIIAYLKGKDAYKDEKRANTPVSTELKQGSYLR